MVAFPPPSPVKAAFWLLYQAWNAMGELGHKTRTASWGRKSQKPRASKANERISAFGFDQQGRTGVPQMPIRMMKKDS